MSCPKCGHSTESLDALLVNRANPEVIWPIVDMHLTGEDQYIFIAAPLKELRNNRLFSFEQGPIDFVTFNERYATWAEGNSSWKTRIAKFYGTEWFISQVEPSSIHIKIKHAIIADEPIKLMMGYVLEFERLQI